MAINIANETIVSLTEATKILPKVNGKRPAISTLWRWCRKGLHGVHLDYIRIGRNIATSHEALNRFFVALAEQDEPLADSPREPNRSRPATTARDRERSLADADRVLDRAGI
ncbi:MAG: DUF1580 domain-containing protein [Phycisphaerales bacterium]|nr:DUF1580 domain-containing protein [Phycisphaerales bacterium]